MLSFKQPIMLAISQLQSGLTIQRADKKYQKVQEIKDKKIIHFFLIIYYLQV